MTVPVADSDESGEFKGHSTTKVSHVVEQRVSNLAQGLLTLGTMTGPLLVVLHLIPQAVLAGLFFVMGVQALEGNGITLTLLFLCRDRTLTPASEPLKRVERRSAVWIFVGIQLLGFAATFAITQTIAAVGFPVIILLLIPVRTWLLPRWFSEAELQALDSPTASKFTMISVGGNYGETGEDVVDSASEGILGGDTAERGEGRVRRRGSWRGEEGSGRMGESIEMRSPAGVNRRSVSRQSK